MYRTAKKIVQFFLCLLLIGIPCICKAEGKVRLQWEPHIGNVEGYQVFGRAEGQEYDYDFFWWQGDRTHNRCIIDGLDENTTYYFVVRSFLGDDLSCDSKEVSFNPSDAPENSSGGGSGCFVQSLRP